MLFLSLLFVLAGVSLLAVAAVMSTYIIITTGEKNLRTFLAPKSWTPPFRKWVRCGGIGLASTFLGMIMAVIAT